MPYVNLLTRIKSPTNKVGIIEPEGILNGSAIKDLNISTINTIGKNERAYSTNTGSCFTSKAWPCDLRNNK